MKRAFVISMMCFFSSFSYAKVNRPPQFVALAFDGSKANSFWNESRVFAQDNDVKFTYFVNGVYFLTDSDHGQYYKDLANAKIAGKSAIGWGGTDMAEMKKRLGHVKGAMAEGHEMASHGNAHFDGSGYSVAQWTSDFSQFATIMAGAFQRYDAAKEPAGWAEYWVNEVVGFRAPQLGKNDNLWTVLNDFDYTYDTSEVKPTNYWPTKDKGFWNFALGGVTIIGQDGKVVKKANGKAATTLSMDYNFYVYDSKGVAGPAAQHQRYEDQMFNTYMNYFNSNYYGNRAPVHIGHHFSKWNGGAYWKAMQRFAQAVCAQPEVICGTYKDLVVFMEDNKANIASLQKGDFIEGVMAQPGLVPMRFTPALTETELDELRAQSNDHFNAHDEE